MLATTSGLAKLVMQPASIAAQLAVLVEGVLLSIEEAPDADNLAGSREAALHFIAELPPIFLSGNPL